jgi:putative glutamine amidotransferase
MNRRRKPVIGITADIDFWTTGRPPRAAYLLEATNFDALRAFGAASVMLPSEFECIDEYLDLCDGIVVSGGGYQFQVPQMFRGDGSEPLEKEQRFRFEAEMTRRSIACRKPLLAICGGFQVLNHVMGGELVVNLAAEREEWASHSGPSFREIVHPVKPVRGTRFEAICGPAAFGVNSMHKQGVVRVGPRAVIAATSSDGLVEAIEMPEGPFCVGVQWHPEFLLSQQERQLLAAFVDASRA